jgi:hypothetical protein
MIKTTTFEIPIPVREVSPQWINFIHTVNRLAREADQPEPFGAPIKEIDRGHARGEFAEYTSDIGIEIYPEALIVHTKKTGGDTGTIGVTRFEPQSSRVLALMVEAAADWSEANVTTPEPYDVGAYYTRARAKIEALEILEEWLSDQGEVPHIDRVRRNLEAARVID